MSKIPIAAEWQCSLDLLNKTVYRKYQHASQHNPIKCGPFTIPKKKSPLKQNMDPLYKKSLNYKLPQVCTNRIRHTMNTQSKKDPVQLAKEGNMFSFYNPKQSKNPSSIGTESMNSTLLEDSHSNYQKKQYSEKLQKLKQNLLCNYKFGERDRFFSYVHNIIDYICSIIQNQKDKQTILQTFVNDIGLLFESIDKNKSFVSVIKTITAFKKQEKYFCLKASQFKILFQILLAQFQMLQNNINKAIENFQFCEYHCRKNNMQQLTISFLWQISLLNISSLKYQEADENLRNLLQMALVSKKKKAIKYSLEKISLLYYYRGNSIMGQYYLKKSEEGLSNFQSEIYMREYNKNDEIKRLQNKLFNVENQERIIKRKNNPKFEADIWRQSKEQYEKTHEQYMERVKKMIKTHESAEQGRKIKKMVAKISCIGDIRIAEKSLYSEKFQRNKNKKQEQKTNLSQGRNERNSTFRISQASCKQSLSQSISNSCYIDNVTRVIKTHLSMNRDGATIKRQHRWRKFSSFLILLEAELKQLLKFTIEKKCKQTPINRAQF